MKRRWHHAAETLRVFGYICMLSAAITSAVAADAPSKKFIPLSIEQLYDTRYAYRNVAVTGVVEDVIADEIDKEHVFFLLSDGKANVLAPLRHAKHEYEKLRKLIGARVIAFGYLDVFVKTHARRMQGPTLNLRQDGDAFKVLESPGDLFDVPFMKPPEGEKSNLAPSQIADMGRRRTHGRVIARLGRSAFLKTAEGFLSRVDFVDENLPAPGASVEVVGFPETDLYRLNFSRAIWRPAAEVDVPSNTPVRVTAPFLTGGSDTEAVVQQEYHGRTIRLAGRVVGMTPVGGRNMLIDSDGVLVSVEICEKPSREFEAGTLVDVSGVCIMDIANWTAHNPFPQIKGFCVAVEKESDIRVLANPPWWTIARMLCVVGALLAVIVWVVVWNVALRRSASRKSEELLREQVDRLSAELKTEERTRLAVELHDSFAQNLTGVTFEVDTANKLSETDSAGMKRHLVTAALALKSCQAELRDCLWDLRHGALEAVDMDSAIHQTLAGHMHGAEVAVRFNVPRERLSDNTAHAILRIIRELTVNAVRHGGARHVRVAGCLEDGKLFFSVSDDGSGFDVESAPGLDKGHYGLTGIRERIETYEGRFTIESAIGKGTKATVVLNMPQEGEE